MNLRILAEAEGEIDAARRYLNQRVEGLGGRFLEELAETLDAIAARPLSFASLETLPNSPYRRAQLATFRFIVVFEVLNDDIVVVAVAHSSRATGYWLGRRM